MFRAKVMACSADKLLKAWTGISVRALSSSHRCLREYRPLKQLGGTELMWLASRRLGKRASKNRRRERSPGTRCALQENLNMLINRSETGLGALRTP